MQQRELRQVPRQDVDPTRAGEVPVAPAGRERSGRRHERDRLPGAVLEGDRNEGRVVGRVRQDDLQRRDERVQRHSGQRPVRGDVVHERAGGEAAADDGRRAGIDPHDEMVGRTRNGRQRRDGRTAVGRGERRRDARERVHLDVRPIGGRRAADDGEVGGEGHRLPGEVDERPREGVRAVGERAGGVRRRRTGDRGRDRRGAVEGGAGDGGEALTGGDRDRARAGDGRAVRRRRRRRTTAACCRSAARRRRSARRRCRRRRARPRGSRRDRR